MQLGFRLLLAACLLTVLSACGNGGGREPESENTALNGQLVQAGPVKVVSADGDGLSNVSVQLLSATTAQILASAVTDSNGRFSFRDLSGGSFLLRYSFNSSVDFDGDGSLDSQVVFIPISLSARATTELVHRLSALDTDSDGQLDSLELGLDSSSSIGLESERRQLRFRHGQLRIDIDGDGDFDSVFDDEDCDGLPEDDRYPGPRGPKLRGDIEAISNTSITVAGVTFSINAATRFWVKNDRNAGSGQFNIGDEVQITSLPAGQGQRVALIIKLKHDSDNPGQNDTEILLSGELEALSASSLSIAGLELDLSGRTRFYLQSGARARFEDFSVGDFVEITAIKLRNDSWLALRIQAAEQGTQPDGTLRVEGSLSSISSAQASLDGLLFRLNAQTQFLLEGGASGSLGDFEAGQQVAFLAELQGGVWTVLRLSTDTEADFGSGGGGTRTVSGSIQALSSSSVSINGESFSLNSATQLKIAGQSAGLTDFFVGANVTLSAVQSGSAWLATSMSIAAPGLRSLSGSIESISAAAVRVNGTELAINSATKFFIGTNEVAIADLFTGVDADVQASFAGGQWTATRITLAGSTQLELNGVVEAIGADSLTVDGRTIRFGAQTLFQLIGGASGSIADIDPGDAVEVSASFNGSFWLASRIEVTATSDEQTVFGRIGLLSSSSLSINGQAYALSGLTSYLDAEGGAAVQGDFSLGQAVRLRANLVGSAWVATQLQLQDELTFRGELDAISATAAGISGLDLNLNSHTSFRLESGAEAGLGDFSVGDYVEIKALQTASGMLVLDLQLKTDSNPLLDNLEIIGRLSALSSGSLSINGLDLSINASTVFLLEGGATGSIGDFAVGDTVKVSGTLVAGLWVATEVNEDTDS
ncbi:carboxypeptidase regulatory-like domain-containing protein [bacterium]|nr:carboxypeptidase regulatory-like domain-containing protein [bacterium]